MKNFNQPLKAIGIILLVVMMGIRSEGATITSTATGGTWSTGSTWVGGVAPASGDDAIIATTGGNSVTLGATTTCLSITVIAGSSLSVNSRTFTVNGAVNNAGTITVSTGRIAQAGTGDFTNSGTITYTGSGRIYFTGNFTNTGTLTLLSSQVRFTGSNTAQNTVDGFTTTGEVRWDRTAGSVTFNGNVSGGALTMNSGGTLNLGTGHTHTFTGTWDRSGGTLNGGSSTINFSAASPVINSTGTFTPATGTVNFSGGSNQTVPALTYFNLTLSGGGIKTFSTTPTVNGVLSLEGTASVTVSTGVVTYGTNATLQYNKPAAYTATSEEWITPFTASGGVIIANTGAITSNSVKVFNATAPLTINSGATLNMSTFLLTLNGNLINNGGTTSGSGGLTITGTGTQSIGAFTTTGTVSMTKASGTATFTGNVSGGGLTINGTAGTLNLGTGLTHTFSGTWTRTAGTLNGGSSTIIFTLGGPVHSGTGGTFTANTGTVNYAFNAAGGQTVVPLLVYYNLTLSGSGTKTMSSVSTINNNLTLSGTASVTAATTMTIGGDVILESGTFSGETFTINVGGNWTNNGGTFTPATSTINFNNTSTGKAINGSAASQTFNNVSINNGNQTLTAGSNLTIATLTSSVTSTLELGTKTLTVTTATGYAGTINTQNLTSTPFSSGKTWGGTIVFNAAAPQTVVSGTYNNVTISSTGGATTSGNITVNGILNLASANASATQGCLETNSNSVTMGGSATTTGPGDVTGVVTRTSFVAGTPYTFGNQFTTLNLSSIGTLTSLSVKIVLAVVPWTPTTNTVKRYYEIIQSGGSAATIVTMDLHYLDTELNGASENSLVFWDVHNITTFTLHEHSRSSYNSTDNWVEMTNLTLTYIAPASTFGASNSKYYYLADWTAANKSIWYGHTSGAWDIENNWTGGIPTTTSDVIIPDSTTTDFDPILPATLTLKSLAIQTNGYLDGSSTTLTLTGGSGAWLNAGNFISGSGTLIFTGSAATMTDIPPPIVTYNNITVATGAKLTFESGSHIAIKGTLTLEETAILDAATNECTIEYNGTSAQTVINPNASTPGYHNLILSNNLLTLPGDKLYIRGDWTNNVAGLTVADVEFNGPYSMDHHISGIEPTTFASLTINTLHGITLNNVDVTATNMALINGVITTGNNSVRINNESNSAVSRTNGWVNGNLQKIILNKTNYVFETGTNVYAPATIYMSSVLGTVILNAKVTNGNPTSGSGINQALKCDHYWTLTNSGDGSFASYIIKLYFTNTFNVGNTDNYVLRKYQSSWEDASGIVDPQTSYITGIGLTSFSDFEVGEPNTLAVSSQPSSSSVCTGNNTSFTAASTSLPEPTVKWQRKIGAGVWTDITNTTDGSIYSNFTTTTLNITGATTTVNNYTYRAVFTNVNGIVSSSIVTLTVSPASVGGTLTGGTSVCAGAGATLTLGSYTGSIAKWQLTNDGTTWTDIANTTNSYTATNLTATTTYRAVVQSGACSSANSTEQTITVSENAWTGKTSTAWEIAGNWTCGVPTAGTNVIIPNTKTVVISSSSSASPAQCNNLTIEAGGVLVINAGQALTVNGNLTNSAGLNGLVINSDASGTGSLIEYSGATAKVERYIANNFKWHFLSSPVSNQAIWPEFAPAPTGSPLTYGSGPTYNWDFYYYNPNALVASQLYWVNLRKDATGAYNDGTDMLTGSDAGYGAAVPAFVTGRGYLTAYNAGWNLVTGSPTTHNFTGSLNAGTVSHDISFIDGNSYNLMGNPYPSSIDWKAAGWSRSTLTPSTEGYDFWIYNDGTGNYGTYNNSSSTGTNGVTQYIAPGQAFFVKAASSGNLVMSDAIRVHSTQPFLKNSNAETNLIRLKIENTANTYSDEMIVEFNADFSGGGSDKFWSFYAEAPELYSVKDGNNYSIDRNNTLSDDMKVDIAAKTGVVATYTITATNIADFTLRDKVYLLDLKTGIKTNLKQTPSYSFAGTPDDDRNRFQLIFGTSIGVDEETSSDITIYASGNTIYVRNDKASEPYTVMVSNMLGQVFTNKKFAGNTLNQITLNQTPGIYIVTVYSDGKWVSRKVVVD